MKRKIATKIIAGSLAIITVLSLISPPKAYADQFESTLFKMPKNPTYTYVWGKNYAINPNNAIIKSNSFSALQKSYAEGVALDDKFDEVNKKIKVMNKPIETYNKKVAAWIKKYNLGEANLFDVESLAEAKKELKETQKQNRINI